MVIGFVGFGEANSSIAQGLREEGLSEIICFDAMQADPRFRDKIAQKADSCGAKQMESSAMVCQSADIVISGTPSSFALGAAMGRTKDSSTLMCQPQRPKIKNRWRKFSRQKAHPS